MIRIPPRTRISPRRVEERRFRRYTSLVIVFTTTAARILVATLCLAFAGCAPEPPASSPVPPGMAILAADAPGSEPARAPETTMSAAFFAESPATVLLPRAVPSRRRFPPGEHGGPLAGFLLRLDRPPEPQA